MKIKIKQTLRSMWALVLAVLMLLSTFSAVAVTLNKDEIGANVDINSTGWNTGAVTIYFDNTNTNWDTPYLIIGASGWATRYTMERVSGTQYLWKYTFTSSVDGYGAYYFTKRSTGFAGQNENINKIAHMDSGDATHQIAQQMNNNDLYTPASTTTSHSYTDGSTTNSVNTYDVTTSTYATYNVTSSVTGTGSGTITLKDYDNNTIISGSSVPYLTEITATVTPSDGELSSFTAGGTAISSGDKVTIKSATSFNAVINKPNVTVYFYNGVKKYNASELCLYYWETTSNVYLSDKAFKGPGSNGGEKSATASGDYLTYSVPSSAKYVAFARKSGMAGYGELHDTSNTPAIFTKYTSNGDNNNFVPAKFDSSQTVFKPNSSTNKFNSTQYNNGEWSTYGATSPVATELSVSVTSSSPYYVNEQITLNNTATLTDGVNASDVTYSYEYSTDNSTWNAITGTTYTPTSAGTYYFRVTASKDGFTSVTSEAVSVAVSLKDVATSLTVKTDKASYYKDETIKLDKTVNLTDEGSNPTYTYQVKQGSSGSWTNLDTNTYTPTTADTYYFRVKASASGYKDVTSPEISVEVTVKPSVATSVTLTADPATVEKNDPITLTATLNTPATGAENITYKFEKTSGSDGNFTGEVENTTSTTATFTPTATGTYKFKVTASCDGFTSVTSDVIPVTVTEPAYYYIEGRFRVKSSPEDTNYTNTFDDNDSDNWNASSILIPFVKDSGTIYKVETNCTIKELSDKIGGSNNNSYDQFFFVRKGNSTSAGDKQYWAKDDINFKSENMGQKYQLYDKDTTTGTADNKIKFADTNDSTTGPVTVWFDSSTKQLWYTVPEAVKYEIRKSATTNGSFDTEPASEASAGATVTINITPNPGYEVNTVQVVKSGEGTDGQTVEVSDSGNTRTFIMPDKTVTVSVTFKLKDYTMNGVANPSTIGGVVKCTNALGVEIETANKGAKVTFTATPVDGYSVTSWNVTGVDQSAVTINGNTATVTVGTDNVTATANYEGNLFTVTKNLSSNGSYTVTGIDSNNQARCGSTVTINPTPDSGYELDKITVRKTVGGTTSTVDLDDKSFTMPNGDVTITVTFKSNPGTATNYKFLYNSSNSASTMIVIDGKVYENPTNTYTLTITDAGVISNILNNGNSYFALSSTTNYTGIFTKSKSPEVSTDTPEYISGKGPQDNNEGDTKYYYARASFNKKSEIKRIVIKYVYSETSPKYIINAYATSSDKKPLAESVTLEATHTTQVIGKKVTLRATLNDVNAKIPTGAEFKYTFKCGSNVEEEVIVTKTENGPYVATCTVSSDTPGIQSYTVTVSTKESDIVNYTPTDYESVTSNSVDVRYSDVVYYYAAVNPETGAVDTRREIPANNKVETTVSDGGTYYFSVFDNDTDTSPESVVDYTVDSANNRYCTISKSSTETGLDYLIVKCSKKCSNPVIYFDKANKTVYAVATQNIGSEKTLESKKTVTYYFAEERHDSTTQSNPENGGEGMRIKYWNNSVNNSTCVDVTTKVIRPGTDNDGKSEKNNSIFVFSDKFAGISTSDLSDEWINHYRREFYIYSVDLPIWATSFSFVDSNDTALTINNTSQISDNTTTASIVLNPNRVYCFMHSKKNTKNYVRGVVLDDSLWDGKARTAADSNEMATQGFASNLVNYKTETNEKLGNIGFNTALTAKYGTDYEHPLYFNGWYNTEDESANSLKSIYGTTHFKLHDNLAMRYNKDAKSYFASIQNLTDNRLSTTKKNEMGNGYLLGYNGNLMPLFDYQMLNANKTTLVNDDQIYENVQFPFYASTFDGVTTYSYDSTTDRNRLVTTEGGKTTVNVSDGFVSNGSSYGYFPFGGTNSKNTYGFGTEFDINFYMTNNGKLSNNEDIAFNFSGDDDVWVYVDGVRVLDLGGAHSVSSGTINFSDMKVYYKTAANATDNVKGCMESWSVDTEYVKTVSLTDLFEANGVSFSNTDASTQHTLQMFYLERGQGESNCSISFNLPQNTGFRVNSNVTTNNVNEALVQDTMASANKDYFNYQIANKLATSGDNSEYSKITAEFPKAPTPATSTKGLSIPPNPSYPINTISINRDFLGTKYYLTAKSEGISPVASENTWLDSVNADGFTTLKNVNYTLSDAYAVKGASTEETSPSGRVSESGIFNLLFGQSALFESKIPNNTMIQLSQDDKISTVNPGVENSSVITAGTSTRRIVSNYYSSSYTIVDDNTGDEIGSGKKSAGSAGSFYADDASSNKDMFYFANYSGDANTSSNAMTVTYTNDVLTSKIKLAKSVQNPSATDNFYFKVEFSKIFGEALTTAKEYEDLQYKVYNSSNKELVATRTYGKAGVYFTANQYAIIEGVPVDSEYKVVEKDRAGYKFDSASKTTYKGGTADAPVSYIENSVEGETLIGADGTTTYDEITFTNSKQAFTVKFKYYDRAVVSGKASHISTSPTTVTYSYETLDGYTEESDGKTRFKLEDLITHAYAHYKNFDNVIDTYIIYTSQTAAEDSTNGAGSLKVLREDITGVTAGVDTYYDAYRTQQDVDLGLHYDCYGRPQGTVGCNVKDGEDWVTYYSGKTKLTEDKAKEGNSGVNSITVWLYNAPRKYKPTFYYYDATVNGSQLTYNADIDRYVAKNTPYTFSKDVYYNVRLGGVNGNTLNDAATEYLNEYGITKGYCNEIANINSSVTYNNKDLKFLYWASDPSGKTILSTDIAYGYRITNNLKAYAVYGVNDFNAKGLTITPNTPDYYSNNTGKALLRLNNVMNVYGCPERDRNIKNASIIYIIDYSDNNKMDELLATKGGFKALQEKVQEVVKKYETSKNFVEGKDIVIETGNIKFNENPTGNIDITGFNHKVVPYNEAITDTNEIKLTNKNRVQFTTSFTKSNLKDLKMYAMLGMDYGEVVDDKNTADNHWIVSDNLLYYAFDTSGNVTSIEDPILEYTFYSTAP